MVNVRLKTLLSFIIALLVILPSVAHAVWNIQGVDTPKSFTKMSSKSITIDSTTGYPHIAYGGDQLRRIKF